MRIALTGSTTEPVISHSTANVSTTSSPTASGRFEPIASCWSTNSAAAPPTSSGYGAGPARISPDQRPRRVALGLAGDGDVDLPGRVVQRAAARPRRARRAAARARPRTRATRGPLARRRVERDRDRARVLAAEVARQRVGDGARALRPSGSRRSRPASRPRAAPAARGRASAAPVTDRHRQRAAHHRVREPVPRALLGRALRPAPAHGELARPRARTAPGRSRATPAPATSATTAPAIPIDCRNPSGNTVSVISAKATVTAL